MQNLQNHFAIMARMFHQQSFNYVARLISNLRKVDEKKADMFCKALFQLHHNKCNKEAA